MKEILTSEGEFMSPPDIKSEPSQDWRDVMVEYFGTPKHSGPSAPSIKAMAEEIARLRRALSNNSCPHSVRVTTSSVWNDSQDRFTAVCDLCGSEVIAKWVDPE